MSRTATRSTSSKAKGSRKRPSDDPRWNDTGLYVGVVLIGAFIGLLGMFSGRGNASLFLLIYGTVLLAFINYTVWSVYFGRSLPIWQKAFARLVLRFGGYGVPKKKPLPAAKGQDDARMIAIVATVVSVLAIVVAGAIRFGGGAEF